MEGQHGSCVCVSRLCVVCVAVRDSGVIKSVLSQLV